MKPIMINENMTFLTSLHLSRYFLGATLGGYLTNLPAFLHDQIVFCSAILEKRPAVVGKII